MLADVLAALRCPVCLSPLTQPDSEAGQGLRCTKNHSFDWARQGYVNLLAGKDPGTGDDADMVRRRAAFLGAGHYAPIAETLPTGEGLIVEVGAGTGYYLAHVLDRSPQASGLALDLSKFAARRAARAHPRAESVVANCWERLPVADSSVRLLLDVFAPRNATEFARVLAPDGQLAVVTPLPEHLVEIRESLGMLTVEEGKTDRVRDTLGPEFVELSETHVRRTMVLTQDEVGHLVGMGPSARHFDVNERVTGLPPRVEVSLAVRLGLYGLRRPARNTR